VKKLLFLVAFAGSVTFGAACTSELEEACNNFVTARNGCEGQNEDEPPLYSTDLCGNIDVECKEYYACAAESECKEDAEGKFRLQTRAAECELPENKECTDADLRP